ncbi:DUF2793 domain-containing protein [Paracoccus yeei]|uniref:DUF2793 domain-containing protein n=1 Tax=Paracoccus yeei TaxID=147645 RepID=UPI001748DAD6|nr:DUF2793 domain-containing protein [Paracoccus yeei]
MPATNIPGVGISAKWAEGENGWGTGMDENLVRLSALTQLSVPSVSASLSAGSGVQIAPPSHENAGRVAININDVWWFYQPFTGMRAWVRDVSAWFVFDGSGWVREANAAHVVSPVVTTSRAITEAEFATGATIVVNSADDVVMTVPGPGASAPQMGASVARRPVTIVRMGTGNVSVSAAAGSTLLGADDLFSARARYSPIVVVPVQADQYIVGGDLV